MVHVWNLPSGTGNAYCKPAGGMLTSLVRYHTWHPATKCLMFTAKFGHHTRASNADVVLGHVLGHVSTVGSQSWVQNQVATLPVSSKAALATRRFSGKLVFIEKYKFIWHNYDCRAVPSNVLPLNGFSRSTLKWLTDGAACYAAPLMWGSLCRAPTPSTGTPLAPEWLASL